MVNIYTFYKNGDDWGMVYYGNHGIVLPTFECVFLTPINAMMAIFFDGNITGNQCNLTMAKMTDVLLVHAGF